MVSLSNHRPPYLIITIFYSLSTIGPFYPSSYLLLPSFYPKAYHYVISETEGDRSASCAPNAVNHSFPNNLQTL